MSFSESYLNKFENVLTIISLLFVLKILEKEQEKIKTELAKYHEKPGLLFDPLERVTLLYLREIGKGEEAVIKNSQIERDWKLVKKGPITVYRNFMIEPGKPTDVLKGKHRVDAIYQTEEKQEKNKDILDLLQRYYNKDEITHAISTIQNPKTKYEDRINANEYLHSMTKQMNKEKADWVIGGKKGKKTKKRKTNKKRKSLKKRKTNKKRKSLKK